MCVLSDADIAREVANGRLKIEPFYESQLRPNGYDFALGDTIKEALTPFNTWASHRMELSGSGHVLPLKPGKFYLLATRERIALPRNMMAEMVGRSSLARRGLTIHKTAGDCDPGWAGYGTLEAEVEGPWELSIYPGMLIGKYRFTYLSTPAKRAYNELPGSKYMDQPNYPVESRIELPKDYHELDGRLRHG